MLDTSTQGLNGVDNLSTAMDSFTNIPFDRGMWNVPMGFIDRYTMNRKRIKFRDYQNKGHKEKVVASRRRKNKLAKKARKRNRR